MAKLRYIDITKVKELTSNPIVTIQHATNERYSLNMI